MGWDGVWKERKVGGVHVDMLWRQTSEGAERKEGGMMIDE